MRYFCGIDNGKAGAFAVIDEEQNIILCKPMPLLNNEYDLKAIRALLEPFLQKDNKLYVVLEKAYMMPKNGCKANFSTGFNWGLLRGMFEVLDISYEIVGPKQWQSSIFQGMNCDDTKKASIEFCQHKYPTFDFRKTERSKKLSDGLTDALCMSIYCHRLNK